MRNIQKIVYFLDIPDFIGGANKVLLTQACILKRRGYQVKVMIPEQGRDYHIEECAEICERNGVELSSVYYTVAVCMENIDILQALKDHQNIVRILREDKPDLIHSVQLNIAVELAARELGIPHLMNIYQTDREAFNVDWMKVYPQYHSADSLLVCERWGKGLNIPSRCIRVAYESNQCNKKVKRKESDMITVLSIGLLCERKNQLETLKFVLRCRDCGKSVKLIFLGDDATVYGQECRNFVETNGLQHSVVFKGFVSNIEEYFQKADLLLVASSVESYPGVIVESMANKVPVLSTPVAGVPELVTDEKNGFLTKGYREESIYEAFLRYLSFRESNQIGLITENAYNTYLANHTYQTVGDQLEGYYQWIMEDYHSKNASFLIADQVRKMFGDNRIPSQEAKFVWFLNHVFDLISQKENRKIAIWGAGYWGSRVLEWIRVWGRETDFAGFMDTNKRGSYLGYPIAEDRETLITECGTVFIALGDTKGMMEIINYLENLGKLRNRDYFLACNAPFRI